MIHFKLIKGVDNIKSIPPKKYIRSVKKYDFFCKNEIRISENIKTIYNYFLYFQPIVKCKLVELSNTDTNSFEEKNRYMLTIYEDEYSPIKDLISSFNYEISNRLNIKIYVMRIINSLQYVFYSLSLLYSKNIVHCNIIPLKIRYKDNIILLRDFSNSFNIDEINDNNIFLYEIFKKYDPKNVYMPLEFHLICFMIEYNMESISQDNINTITNDYFKNINQCSFSGYYERFLVKEDINYLKNFINKSRNVIINQMLYYSQSWDNYSISIIYLQILFFIEKIIGFQNIFVDNVSRLLIGNISMHPGKRNNINKTRLLFDNILYSITEKEWNSIFLSSN